MTTTNTQRQVHNIVNTLELVNNTKVAVDKLSNLFDEVDNYTDSGEILLTEDELNDLVNGYRN